MKKKLKIAIDGPASAGKSTVAKILAKDLEYVYCDTGAMYRALTFAALQNDIDPANERDLLQLLKEMSISFEPNEESQRVLINGKDVTEAIRKPDVTNLVSTVAAHREIRQELVQRQHTIAGKGGVVMDGRDIGTAVLPNAEVKIFLIASVEERAERRYNENLSKGIHTPLDQLQEEIAYRDYQDMNRSVSPLTKAEDAVEVDTTSLTIEEVVKKIKEIIDEKTGNL